MERLHIRWMDTEETKDGPHVDLEQTTAHPATLDELREVSRQRNCISMVAEHGVKVVGYFIYELHKHKLIIRHFAVDPDYQRRGVGRAMIEKLQGKLSFNRRNRIVRIERETNTDGLLFLKAMGFEAAGTERDAFADTGEDAVKMVYRLPVALSDDLITSLDSDRSTSPFSCR